MTETKPKPKTKRFKYTRELVRIALDEGMTQMEIAALCRVQQSKVSAWARGESKAREHEVAELKKRFGHRLNRTTSRVYLVAKEEGAQARWEDTERARRLLDIQAQLGGVNERLRRLPPPRASKAHRVTRVLSVDEEEESPAQHGDPEALEKERAELEAKQAELEASLEEIQTIILNGDPNGLSLGGLIRLDQEEFKAARWREQVTQVEGPVVLRYTFTRPESVVHGKAKELKRLPVARWLVHRQPDGRFVLVTQARRTLSGAARWRWWNALRLASEDPERHRSSIHEEHRYWSWTEDAYVECADDAARWLSLIHGPMDSAALLSHCDEYFRNPSMLHGPHDEPTLPFLLRKMIVEQGDEVPGLVRIVASE